jgi:hypothetical protein
MKKDMCLAFCEGFWFRFGVYSFYLSCLGVIVKGHRYHEGTSTSNHY